MLLNGTPFAFVIDLAALASRREYLKLDKWLTDKIREHGVSGIVHLLLLLSFDGQDNWRKWQWKCYYYILELSCSA